VSACPLRCARKRQVLCAAACLRVVRMTRSNECLPGMRSGCTRGNNRYGRRSRPRYAAPRALPCTLSARSVVSPGPPANEKYRTPHATAAEAECVRRSQSQRDDHGPVFRRRHLALASPVRYGLHTSRSLAPCAWSSRLRACVLLRLCLCVLIGPGARLRHIWQQGARTKVHCRRITAQARRACACAPPRQPLAARMSLTVSCEWVTSSRRRA